MRIGALTPLQRRMLAARLAGDGSSGSPWPLTATQVGIWIEEQLGTPSAVYNNALLLEISGPLDVAALQRSLAEIHARHPALRLRIEDDDGEPVGRIQSPGDAPLAWRVVDVPDASQDTVEATARAAAQTRIGLDGGPTWRTVLLRCSPVEHSLVLVLHHVAADGSSLRILLDELRCLYEAHAFHRAVDLPVPRRPQPPTATAADDDLAYWIEHLAGAPRRAALAGTDPRHPGGPGSMVPVTVPPETAARLRSVCGARGATLFAGLLAAWVTAVRLGTAQEDLVVRSTVEGRDRGSASVVGCFVNTVALRFAVPESSRLVDVLAQSRQELLGAMTHAAVPFARVVAALPSSPDSGRVLGNVSIAQNNAMLGGAGFGGLTVRQRTLAVGAVKHDLCAIMGRDGDQLAGTVEITDRLHADVAVRVMRGLVAAIDGLAAGGTATVADLRRG